MAGEFSLRTSLNVCLKQSQRLTLRQQLSIKLLQLGSLELSNEIREKLESNIMLELAEDSDAEDNAPTHLNDAELDYSLKSENAATSSDGRTDDSLPNDAATTLSDLPKELPIDVSWDDISDTESSIFPVAPSANFSDGMSKEAWEYRNIAPASLRNYLLKQLDQSPLPLEEEEFAFAIIDSLNEDGFLSCALEEILPAGLKESTPDWKHRLERSLHFVQSLEPTGVGARNLRECLLLQLAELPKNTPFLAEVHCMVDKFLTLLSKGNETKLIHLLKLKNHSELNQVSALVRRLDPQPGKKISELGYTYIRPDIHITRNDSGKWTAHLNEELYPALRINPYYERLITRRRKLEEEQKKQQSLLKEHMSEAKWFIDSIKNRGHTLLKVAQSICACQGNFLNYGSIAMRPLTLRKIAEELEMHESTISRAISGKYMQTPHGVLEFKRFFSSSLATHMGSTCSSISIQARIERFIKQEDHAKPLSDMRIAHLLTEQGIEVARRTVAKYRETLNIPPSNERKRIHFD